MSDASLDDLAEFAVDLALRAGRIQRELFGRLTADAVQFKGRRNPVTEADTRSEELIVAGIAERFPDHSILGEEGGARPGDPARRWVIDPLDGTVNYAHSIPRYSIAIAYEKDGRIDVGVVYSPSTQELFTATRGGGAKRNGTAIRCSDTTELSEAMLATGFGYERNDAPDDNSGHFTAFINRCRDIRRMGSAELDLASVACGQFDGYWEHLLSPWDVAAGSLLVEEAGGVVTDYAGGRDCLVRGQVIATNNPTIHAHLLAELSTSPEAKRGRQLLG